MSEIFVVEATCHGMALSEVRRRVEAGQCLCCEQHAAKRGLCIKCYNAYRYISSKMTKREQAVFDAKLIRRGKLLDRYSAAFRKVKNIFQKFA